MLGRFYQKVCISLGKAKADSSYSTIIVGLIAVTVSYAGPLLVVFQAAKVAHLGGPQLSSWIWAISFGSGLTGLILSSWFKTPVIIAWSTPGAVLLVSGWAAYGYSDAIGAFILSGLLITILGLTNLFSTIMNRIPHSIVTAMLAGILLKFGIEVFVSLKTLPLLALPMLLCYLLSKRWIARYAIVTTLPVGLIIAYCQNLLNFGNIDISLVTPILTKPTFSFDALIGLGIPLCIVTMASQNATGIGVLRADGYDTPASPLIASTGFASLLLAPFGAHGINLAAITAAICTGKEAHFDPDKRYIAGISCGAFYMVLSIFGATIASAFAAFPSELIAVIAGLALLGSLSSSLSAAMKEDLQRESALITFLVTISGISIAGVGAAFWGLLAGISANFLLNGDLTRKRSNLLLSDSDAPSLGLCQQGIKGEASE